MLRHTALLLSLIFIVLVAAFIMSCGGSSHHANACTGTYTIVGDWQGSVTSDGSTDDFVGTIDSTGNGVFFDGLADIVTVNPLSGACSFTSSNETVYESIENGGPATATGSATGNVTSDSAFNGSESSNGTSGTFSFTSYNPLGTGSVTAVSGIVGADVEGQVSDLLDLTLGGTAGNITFSGNDSQCNISGAFTQEGTNNLYSVTFNVSGNGESCSGNFTGVGFESDSDLFDADDNATGTYLYGTLISSSGSFVVEIEPSGSDAAHRRALKPNANSPFHKVFGFVPGLSRQQVHSF
jgi:hypothetical protein